MVHDPSDACRVGFGAMELGASLCLMLAMGALLGGPIGPRHGVEGRRTEGGLFADAENPMTPRILLALLALMSSIARNHPSRWLAVREDISAETYISGPQPCEALLSPAF